MTQHYLLNIIIKKKNERTNRIEIFFHCFVLLVLLRYNIVFLFLDLLFRSLDVVRIAIMVVTYFITTGSAFCVYVRNPDCYKFSKIFYWLFFCLSVFFLRMKVELE